MSPALPRTIHDDLIRHDDNERSETDLRDRLAPSLRPVPHDAPFIDDGQGLVAAGTVARTVKRVIDIVGSAVLLIVIAPVMLAIALMIWLTSKGPVLFRQERVGEGGRRFEILKFRTMRVDAEDHRHAIEDLNEADGPVFKIRQDPRVTGIGRPLRRWSLDELPQLLNVLRGDMSLVGPRPPLPSEVETYNVWELQRLEAKPGLTCIWQVSGRSEVDFRTWVEMDLEYIATWSLVLDLVLLAKTVPAVLKRDGAY